MSDILTFKEFILSESTFNGVEFDRMKGTSGNGLALVLSKEQNDKLIEFIESKAELKWLLRSEKEYSESVHVKYKDFQFSLYPRDGVFRLGGDISTGREYMSSIKELKENFNIDEFLKDLTK